MGGWVDFHTQNVDSCEQLSVNLQGSAAEASPRLVSTSTGRPRTRRQTPPHRTRKRTPHTNNQQPHHDHYQSHYQHRCLIHTQSRPAALVGVRPPHPINEHHAPPLWPRLLFCFPALPFGSTGPYRFRAASSHTARFLRETLLHAFNARASFCARVNDFGFTTVLGATGTTLPVPLNVALDGDPKICG